MNIKKIFRIEILCGVILLSYPVISLFVPASHLGYYLASAAYVIMILIYFNFIHRKKNIKNETEWLIMQIGSAVSIIILIVVSTIFYFFFRDIKTAAGEPLSKYWRLFLIPAYLLIHPIIEIVILNGNRIKTNIENQKDSLFHIFTTDSYIEISNGFFVLIILAGIFFLLFDYWQIEIKRLFVWLPAIFIIVYIYDYKSKVKKKIKRAFDEREKYYLYKTISISTLFFIISLLVLFSTKDFKLLNHSINEMWGIFVFPIFLLIWGIVGLVVTLKEN